LRAISAFHRHNKTQRHYRCLDRQRRLAKAGLRAPSSCAIPPTCTRSDRSTSRLVSNRPNDQHCAEQSRRLRYRFALPRVVVDLERQKDFESGILREPQRPITRRRYWYEGPPICLRTFGGHRLPADVPSLGEMFTGVWATPNRRMPTPSPFGNLNDSSWTGGRCLTPAGRHPRCG